MTTGTSTPETEALTAGASGSTSLPLSDRNTSWDAGAARKALNPNQYADAHFWRDPNGDPKTLAAYKLPFASNSGGKLTAIWSGVTAAAQRLSGTDIPSGDVAGVQAKIAAYYKKAATKFNDPEIEPPWVSDSETEPDKEAIAAAGNNYDGPDAGSGTETLPPEHMPGERKPKRNPTPKPKGQTQTTNASQLKWEATFAPEGELTDDNRMFWPGSISWRDLPLTLMAMTKTADGHDGAEAAGRIDRIWRDGNMIRAEGVFDNNDFGSEIARKVGDGMLTGLSVDIAPREYERLPHSQVFDEEGNVREDALTREPESGEEPDLLDLLFGGEDLVSVVLDGIIGAATVCPFPAFSKASISLAASGEYWHLNLHGGFRVWRVDTALAEEESLTAAAAGLTRVGPPPAAWFENPNFADLTPLQVTDEGHVYGHAAQWGTCHIGIPDECTTAPHSYVDYAYFRLGETETDNGKVTTGTITLGTGHADRGFGRRAAAEHYDDTGTAVADVVVGEDDHGIWFSGALRPDVPAERIHELRASGGLSGDWREVNGNLELVALLAVNVPGFPIPRAPKSRIASGKVITLLSAGMVHERLSLTPGDRSRLAALSARAKGGLDGLAALARGEIAA